ncbi:MAG: magnesium transporter, partial [Polyangiales bacterium]
DVLGRVGREELGDLLRELPESGTIELLSEMSPDDRVDVVQELEDEHAEELLSRLEKTDSEAAEEVRELGAWGPETAGGLMTPDYAALPPEMKVWEAIDELRRLAREGEAETIYSVYVCGYGDKLLGVISLRELILAEPAATLADVMHENVVRVEPEADQEQVAERMARYDLSVLPVVDHQGRMLGVVTIDDVMDVVIEEATEDAHMMGGVVPLEDSYFATGTGEFVWKRAAWLVILFLGQMLTANVMESNEHVLRATLELAVFIPLIIASGGNAGAQSSTLIIRGLAVGELRPGDWLRVALRELWIGLAMGVLLGGLGFLRAWVFGEPIDAVQLGLVVGASIVAVVTLGTLIGSLLPLGIRKVGMDPAVSSTPFIASVIDVLGLVVYFAIAQVVLALVF